ncbi:unnamed protein product, partial [Ectocarpus sp. 8 AP-2014]
WAHTFVQAARSPKSSKALVSINSVGGGETGKEGSPSFCDGGYLGTVAVFFPPASRGYFLGTCRVQPGVSVVVAFGRIQRPSKRRRSPAPPQTDRQQHQQPREATAVREYAKS